MRAGRKLPVPALLAVLLGSFGLVPPVHAATIRQVPADYATISLAIAASSSGDTVQVAAGTYPEKITVPAGLTVESTAGALTTIIDGGFQAPVATIDAGAVVDGFTLQNGAGGMEGTGARVAGTLQNSRIINNTSCFAGVAAHLVGGTLEDNFIQGNVATCSPGAIVDGNGLIMGNEFANNPPSFGTGLAISINDTSPTIDGNYFHGAGQVITGANTSTSVIRNNLVVSASWGAIPGLIDITPFGGAGPTIVNNTFILKSGLGPVLTSNGVDAPVIIANNVFAGPSGSRLLGCTNDYDSVPPSIQANDFWTPSGPGLVDDCTGLAGTAGNLSVDPKFVEASLDDYHLRAYSPLIDKGVNGIAVAPDYDGDARPLDGDENGTATVDIGFDETLLALSVTPEPLNWGNVPATRPVTKTVTAKNVGSDSIDITSVGLSGANAADFSITADPCTGVTLAVGATCVIGVTLTASTFFSRTAVLSVTGPDEVGTVTVPLSGYGIEAITISPVDFHFPASIIGTAPVAKTITVTNHGAATNIASVTKSGADAAAITIGAQTCTSGPLAQDASCTIPFTYAPKTPGAQEATIAIAVQDFIGTRTVPIYGSASQAVSHIGWGSISNTGPSYTWNGGGAFARTVQSGTQRLHVAYATNRVGGKWATDKTPKVGVYYIRSSAGTTWTTPKRLNSSSQHATQLGLAAGTSKVFAIWVSQTKWVKYSATAARVLYVRVNTNHGASSSWRSAKALTSSSGRVDYAVIAATGNDAHIAWTNADTGTMWVASSRDGGLTWVKTSVGSTTINFTDGRTGFPTIAASGGNVAMCWLSDTSGTVKCRVSTNRGVSWGTTQTVGSQANGYFTVAVRGSRMAVTWATSTSIVVSKRASVAWTTPVVVTKSPVGVPYGPQIALQDPDRMLITWSDPSGSTATRLYSVETSNGGTLWYAIDVLATSTSTRQANDWPAVVWPSAGTRYIVWNGWTDGTNNYHLYLRKGTGTPSGPAMSATSPLESGHRPTVLAPSPAVASSEADRH